MSALANTPGKQRAPLSPHVDPVPAMSAGFAWFGYLLLQYLAIGLGLESIHGSLLRLGAAMLYFGGTLLMWAVFRHHAPVSATFQASCNILAVIFHVVSITKLLQIQPDIATFEQIYIAAQILMALSMYGIARCVQVHPAFKNWLAILLYIYAVICTIDASGRVFDVAVTELTTVSLISMAIIETALAYALVRVGIREFLKRPSSEL